MVKKVHYILEISFYSRHSAQQQLNVEKKCNIRKMIACFNGMKSHRNIEILVVEQKRERMREMREIAGLYQGYELNLCAENTKKQNQRFCQGQ
jgi:hypothetical protein